MKAEKFKHDWCIKKFGGGKDFEEMTEAEIFEFAYALIEDEEETIEELKDKIKELEDEECEEVHLFNCSNGDLVSEFESRFDISMPDMESLDSQLKFEHLLSVWEKYNPREIETLLP